MVSKTVSTTPMVLLISASFVSSFIFLNNLTIFHDFHQAIFHSTSDTNTSIAQQQGISTTLDKYIHYLTSFIHHPNSTADLDHYVLPDNVMIDDLNFNQISVDKIINTLSNKTVVIFGDSLAYYSFSYIVQTLFRCTDYHHNFQNETSLFQLENDIYCNHLKQRQSLILDFNAGKVLYDRTKLKQIIPLFDKHFGDAERGKTMIHMGQPYNITIHLLYKWAQHYQDMNELLQDYYGFVNDIDFDIMINNLMNMHLLHGGPRRRIHGYKVVLDMYPNLESYMKQMIINKKEHQCLIFGPVNPVIVDVPHTNGETPLLYGEQRPEHKLLLKWWSIQLKLLQTKFNIYPDLNVNDLWHIYKEYKFGSKMSRNIHKMTATFTLNETQLMDTMNKEINLDTLNLTNDEMRLIDYCRQEIKDNKGNMTVELDINYCLLYFWGIGNNMYHMRMKYFIDKFTESDHVYYHNQYEIYSQFPFLLNYMYQDVHYPRLLPIGWTNLINMVSNGC